MRENVRKWTKESVIDAIERCRKDEGIPAFRTRMVPPIPGVGRIVFFTCMGGKGTFSPDSITFVSVPEDDYELIKEKVGDWKYLVLKYEGHEKLKELLEYPVRYYSSRWKLLPRELFG